MSESKIYGQTHIHSYKERMENRERVREIEKTAVE